MRGGRLLPGMLALAALVLWLPASIAAQTGGTYTVQPGDSLVSIAERMGTTADAILRANNLVDPDLLWIGQTLVMPGPAAGGASGPLSGRTYTVKLGDRLADIASAFGVTPEALIAANAITDADLLWVGQTLVIPGTGGGDARPAAGAQAGQAATPTVPATRRTDTSAAPTVAPVPGAPPVPTPVQYTVQPGETLGKIAARFNVSAAAIARANGITSPDLVSAGMALKIPSTYSWTSPYFLGPATRFVASISQQRCWLYQGSTVIADWPCSTGQKGTETTPGTYRIQSKMERAYGSAWDIWMPYWLGIYDAGSTENGIHGIPYNEDGKWRLWEGFVGTPITYGCVLLDDANAKRLWNMAYIGMPVIVQQ